ncbi:MAG: FAD-dependent 5-carboxymethylaminomethyl-2-thiouridine(34) oxidoreductase MnmC [Planctomycetota bacterium]
MAELSPHIPWADAVWERGRLLAPAFDDVYRSPQGPWEEAQRVFVGPAGLIERFTRPGVTRLGELGFGAGVSFLAAAEALRSQGHAEARLDALSIEKHPLRPSDLASAIAHLQQSPDAPKDPAFTDLCAQLLEGYTQAMSAPTLRPGDMRTLDLLDGWVRLRLTPDDAQVALHRMVDQDESHFDAWFLDGFAPAKNPAMWSPGVLASVAQLTRIDGRLATYAAAGGFRQALAEAGFEVARHVGFGHKQHRVAARRLDPSADLPAPPSCAKRLPVVVVGAGLAGTAVAHALAVAGTDVVLIDAVGIAAGGSGNAWGVMQPKVAAELTPAVRFTRAGAAVTERWLDAIDAVAHGWAAQTGALHLATDASTERRWRRAAEPDLAAGVYLDEEDAAERAGVEVGFNGLWVERAWVVAPHAVSRAWADHPRIVLRLARVRSIGSGSGGALRVVLDDGQAIEAAGVVLATAHEAAQIDGVDLSNLRLTPVRGQTTALRASSASSSLRCPIHYRGYALPERGGVHWLGSTYGHGDGDASIRPGDDAENISKLRDRCPALAQAIGLGDVEACDSSLAVERRAAVRAVTPDRLPWVGELAPGVWATLGHASHGLTTAPLCAELLRDTILGRPAAHDANLARLASVDRFSQPNAAVSGSASR